MMALSVIQHFLDWFGWDHQKFRDHQENMIKFVSKYCRCFRNTFLLLAITIAKSLWSLFILSVYVTTNFALSECKTWRHYCLTWIGTPKHQKRAHWYEVLVSSKLVMAIEQCAIRRGDEVIISVQRRSGKLWVWKLPVVVQIFGCYRAVKRAGNWDCPVYLNNGRLWSNSRW